ncbi:unnamed protein product [Heterobilharzia americana]|nr:unnamed protein product [Heterobilharzia americana]
MLQMLSSSVVDWMLPTGDIKAVFNDIPTGHTPTNSTDESFRDFSKWENLNTPTPLDKESDYFIYPPNSAIRVEPIVGVEQNIHTQNIVGCNTDNLQIPGAQYIKPDDDYLTQPPIQSSLVYWNLEPYPNTSPIQEIESDIQNETLPLLSPITPVHDYESNVKIDHWSTDAILHSTKSNVDIISNYTCLYNNAFTSMETPTSWATYHDNNTSNTIISNNVVNNSVHTMDQRNYMGPETIHTCSTCPTVMSGSTSEISDQKFNPQSSEYCFNTTCGGVMQAKLSPIHQNNTCPKLCDQQKPFVCGMLNCNKRFVRIDELRRHQRTHSEVKQFVCDICKKGFTRSDHLMTHRRTHTGERPYECKICDRRFARSDERNRHAKTHMRDRPRRGRKPRNAIVQPIVTTTTNISSTVTTNFPIYNVLPCYTMDYTKNHAALMHENNTNNNE